eukprot:3420891-Pleurochrysis_carterae.AAC.1
MQFAMLLAFFAHHPERWFTDSRLDARMHARLQAIAYTLRNLSTDTHVSAAHASPDTRARAMRTCRWTHRLACRWAQTRMHEHASNAQARATRCSHRCMRTDACARLPDHCALRLTVTSPRHERNGSRACTHRAGLQCEVKG